MRLAKTQIERDSNAAICHAVFGAWLPAPELLNDDKAGMTNTLSIILGIILVACIGVDVVLNDGIGLVFLARKFATLIDWLAFWR